MKKILLLLALCFIPFFYKKSNEERISQEILDFIYKTEIHPSAYEPLATVILSKEEYLNKLISIENMFILESENYILEYIKDSIELINNINRDKKPFFENQMVLANKIRFYMKEAKKNIKWAEKMRSDDSKNFNLAIHGCEIKNKYSDKTKIKEFYITLDENFNTLHSPEYHIKRVAQKTMEIYKN